MPLIQQIPYWLSISTEKAIRGFVRPLSKSQRWERISIISPWITPFGADAGLTFEQFIKRIRDDKTSLYVVTRPPVEENHMLAVKLMSESKHANIAYVSTLHTKLFCARTTQGSFAFLGSANFTANSLNQVEIGAVITQTGPGSAIFDKLTAHAAEILPASRSSHFL